MSMSVKKCGLAFLVLAAVTAAWTANVRAGKPAIDKGLVVFLAFDQTADKTIKAGGPHAVKIKADACKLDPAGNGAILDGRIEDDCRGYQMDNNTGTPWLVRLYDEFGRHTLAMRGKRTVFDKAGKRTTTDIAGAGGAARFRLEDWHEYHLICRGPKITLKVNGRLVAEVIDNDPKQQDFSGIFAPQLHSGPPQKVQFKDIRIKRLDTKGGAKQ